MASKRMRISYSIVLIGVFVLLLDQVSKWFVSTHLPLIESATYQYPYGGIGVFRDFFGIEFSLNHMTNTGAAWGMLGKYPLPLIFLRIGLISALIVYFLYFNQHFSWQLPLILVIAGAIGNVIDFFVYGHVVDMFHFVLFGYDFPVFNVADSAITIGIVCLFILNFFEEKK